MKHNNLCTYSGFCVLILFFPAFARFRSLVLGLTFITFSSRIIPQKYSTANVCWKSTHKKGIYLNISVISTMARLTFS